MFQNKVFLALGSNIGNWKKNFNYSLIELSKISNIIAIGNIYVTKPYGFKKQDDFYNTALEIETKDTPFQLINKIKLIEKKLHKNMDCRLLKAQKVGSLIRMMLKKYQKKLDFQY